MKYTTKKITTAAVCTALAVIMCVLTAYLPLSFMPLYLAAFCIFSACKRSGIAFGLLCALASVGLMFLMTGLSVKWLLFVMMFAPYGIFTYFIDRLTYFKVKSAFIRAAVAIVFFNLTFGAVYAVTVNVASVGLEGINIAEWASRVGGYAVLAVIATAVLVPLDFMFSSLSGIVLKRIPEFKRRSAPPANDAPATNDEKKVDDVFGYEIIDKSSAKNEDNKENRDNANEKESNDSKDNDKDA